MSLSGKAAIAGIGATEFSKASGRSELQLSVEAVQHALADCGLTVADVSGGIATLDVVGRVSLGDHVTGTVRVAVDPAGRGGRPGDRHETEVAG